MEEGQPWGTNAPTLHCQWLQIFSSVTEGSCTHSEMSRLFSAEKNGEFPPIPRKIPTLAFSCKLGQKHWHSKFFFSLVIPRNPDMPECLASGILTHLNSQMKMLISSSLPRSPVFCWKSRPLIVRVWSLTHSLGRYFAHCHLCALDLVPWLSCTTAQSALDSHKALLSSGRKEKPFAL